MNKLVVSISLVCGSLGLLGCDGQVDEPTDEGATIEFREGFGAGGVFTVARDHDGYLGISVSQPIGRSNGDLFAKLFGRSPADIYRALNPGQPVPAKLAALSAEVEQRAGKAAAAELQEGLPHRVHESLATFNSTVCKDLPYEGNAYYYWKKIRCDYQPVPGAPPAAWNYYTGDIAAGWNETPGSAYHTNSNSTWKPIIPPHSYYWTQWNMAYEGAVIEMRPYDTRARHTGAYGVTVHRKTFRFVQR
jgi:hypothetical protein